MNAKLDTTSSWHERSRSLQLRTQAFIDGRYVDAASGQTFDCINPANGAVLARVAACDVEDVNRAVASARTTAPSPKLATRRSDTLSRARTCIMQRVILVLRGERFVPIASQEPIDP